jgi:hypothetical protein
MDNSGSVDVGESFTLSEDYVWWELIPSPRFTIYDLMTNEFVSDATVFGEVNWIDDNRYISLDRLVTLNHNGFSEEQIGVVMFTSPDERQLFLNNGSNDLYAVSVLDIASGATTPIIRAMSSNHFQLSYEWQTDNILQVTLTDTQGSTFTELGRWLIRIPARP